jgi:hypothetical protein
MIVSFHKRMTEEALPVASLHPRSSVGAGKVGAPENAGYVA